jgi:type II secretory pathway component GspD/PulD (secretin)
MWKHFILGSILMVGTGLTTICAGFGLDRLLMLASDPHRADRSPAQTKTVLIRIESVDVDEAAEMLRRYTSRRGQIGVNRSQQLVRITDLPRKVDQLKRVLYEIDAPLRPALPVGPIHEEGR